MWYRLKRTQYGQEDSDVICYVAHVFVEQTFNINVAVLRDVTLPIPKRRFTSTSLTFVVYRNVIIRRIVALKTSTFSKLFIIPSQKLLRFVHR